MTAANDERLTAYLDGQLPPEEAIQLEQELSEKPELQHLLGELRIVREYMHKIGPENAPKDFMERVMDAVDMDAARGARRATFSMPMLSMLAAAAMLFIMYGFVESMKPPGDVGAAPRAPEKVLEAAPPTKAQVEGGLINGPVYMAPAAYRFRGPDALVAIAEAAASAGGRLVDQKGEPTTTPNEKGEIWLDVDASQVSRFRLAMEGRGPIETIGFGQVIEGQVKVRLLVVPGP